MQSSDSYVFLARIKSAMIAVAPLGLLMLLFLPKDPLFVTVFFTLVSAVVGPFAAEAGRALGHGKQSKLWKSWGGAPTTRLLRHRRLPGDITLAPGLRQRIEHWAGNPLPTEQQEGACPEWADTKYREVVAILRDATRDNTNFPLVFAENVNYGFRRNVWGLKPIGMPFAVALVFTSWGMFLLTVWGRPWPEPWWGVLVSPDSVAVIRLAVAVAALGYAALWLFLINPPWVKDAADTYAKRLLESVRTLG